MPVRRLLWVHANDGTRLACHFHEPREPKEGAPPLVMTNGIGTTENFWRPLLTELTKDHRVAHWDYRAHGSSAAAGKDGYALATQAADLARVTEAVMERSSGRVPVHVAFSMGVAVVFELYRTRPDLVRSLVLIGGAPDAPMTGVLPDRLLAAVRLGVRRITPIVPTLQPALARALNARGLYALGRALGVLRPRAPRGDIDAMMQAMARMDLHAWALTLQGLLGARGSNVLPSVKVPALIIAALDDVLMPIAQMRRLRDALPKAKYVEVADAGHAGLLEAGDEIARAVRYFLAFDA